MVTSVSPIVEVDPARGNDAPSARPQQPYKTLTAALATLQGNALVKLAPGTYNPSSGEKFPIVVPGGVIINGPGKAQAKPAVISGGGPIADFKGAIALVLNGSAQVRGIRIRNSLGSGVLIVTGKPLIRGCHISRCAQDGVVAAGSAMAQIVKTQIEDNGGRAIYLSGQAKGIIAGCTLRRCQTGVHIEEEASPLIKQIQCSQHQVGVVAAGTSRPVLRGNRIVQNQVHGLWVQGNSHPDLGHPEDPANNIIRYNGQSDIRNDSGQAMLAVGNDLLPQRLQGGVTLAASAVPDPKAVPPSVLEQSSVVPGPVSPDLTKPSPRLPPPPSASASRFPDVPGHWAAAYIEALADRGLVKGYGDGRYRPDETINRAQFAAMVAASFKDQPATSAVTRFRDVPGHHWASNAIAQAQRQGFISGYPDQTFRPNQPMARVQAIVAVARGLKLSPSVANVLSIYRDRAQIPSYATDALAAATQHKLVVNYPDPDQLRPLEAMTRGEVAALLYQGLVAQGKASPLTAQSPVKVAIPQGSFPDIQQHWAQDFIQGLVNQHLMRGYDDGQFYPDRPMTRAQFAALISGAFRPAPQRPARAFRDVPENHWAAQAIQMSYRGGFLSGFPDGSFAPDHSILRVQTWVALVQGLNLLANQAANHQLLTQFADSQRIPDYATDAIAMAAQLHLLVNAPHLQQLNPNRVATRAEIAAIVYQALVYLQQVPKINNPFIVYP
jgi:hypothetical protein